MSRWHYLPAHISEHDSTCRRRGSTSCASVVLLLTDGPRVPSGTAKVHLAALQQLWSSTYNFERLLAVIVHWVQRVSVLLRCCSVHYKHGQRFEWLVAVSARCSSSLCLQTAGLRAGSDEFAPFKLDYLRTRCGVLGSVTLARLHGCCREIMRRVCACLQCVHPCMRLWRKLACCGEKK